MGFRDPQPCPSTDACKTYNLALRRRQQNIGRKTQCTTWPCPKYNNRTMICVQCILLIKCTTTTLAGEGPKPSMCWEQTTQQSRITSVGRLSTIAKIFTQSLRSFRLGGSSFHPRVPPKRTHKSENGAVIMIITWNLHSRRLVRRGHVPLATGAASAYF